MTRFEALFLLIIAGLFICKFYHTNLNKNLNGLFFVSTSSTRAEVISVVETPEQSLCGREPLHEGGQLNPEKLFNGPLMMADAVWALSQTALSSQYSV